MAVVFGYFCRDFGFDRGFDRFGFSFGLGGNGLFKLFDAFEEAFNGFVINVIQRTFRKLDNCSFGEKTTVLTNDFRHTFGDITRGEAPGVVALARELSESMGEAKTLIEAIVSGGEIDSVLGGALGGESLDGDGEHFVFLED